MNFKKLTERGTTEAGISIKDELEDNGLLEISAYDYGEAIAYWINKNEAKQIVEHLIKLFEITLD